MPYLLLTDAQFRFADALSLPRFETGGVTYLKRLTLLVRNGVIYRVHLSGASPDSMRRSCCAELAG